MPKEEAKNDSTEQGQRQRYQVRLPGFITDEEIVPYKALIDTTHRKSRQNKLPRTIGSNSELTPQTVNFLKINDKRCKGDMSTSIGSLFLSPSSGEASAHAARLHLSTWLCDYGLSRYAHGVARSPSSHILLAHFHAS